MIKIYKLVKNKNEFNFFLIIQVIKVNNNKNYGKFKNIF